MDTIADLEVVYFEDKRDQSIQIRITIETWQGSALLHDFEVTIHDRYARAEGYLLAFWIDKIRHLFDEASQDVLDETGRYLGSVFNLRN